MDDFLFIDFSKLGNIISSINLIIGTLIASLLSVEK